MSYAAGIDDGQVRSLERFDLVESEPFEQLSYLLALVLVDFAAKSIYGKSLHNMV